MYNSKTGITSRAVFGIRTHFEEIKEAYLPLRWGAINGLSEASDPERVIKGAGVVIAMPFVEPYSDCPLRSQEYGGAAKLRLFGGGVGPRCERRYAAFFPRLIASAKVMPRLRMV